MEMPQRQAAEWDKMKKVLTSRGAVKASIVFVKFLRCLYIWELVLYFI